MYFHNQKQLIFPSVDPSDKWIHLKKILEVKLSLLIDEKFYTLRSNPEKLKVDMQPATFQTATGLDGFGVALEAKVRLSSTEDDNNSIYF